MHAIRHSKLIAKIGLFCSEEAQYLDGNVPICEDDEELYAEAEGAVYTRDLMIFIRRFANLGTLLTTRNGEYLT